LLGNAPGFPHGSRVGRFGVVTPRSAFGTSRVGVGLNAFNGTDSTGLYVVGLLDRIILFVRTSRVVGRLRKGVKGAFIPNYTFVSFGETLMALIADSACNSSLISIIPGCRT